ncbi:Uu.00g108660.m01.CDS01 [Anthostomella pinea]|uniref:Uu.00g108660.m01.CDS01 n=1 Tax=Anthostomella pinea TaxID=933095 RepID=A0AAI8VFL1_9PEZI|nr:Uu.00g108660.m01.CDS01 [Anthostomella pinea]
MAKRPFSAIEGLGDDKCELAGYQSTSTASTTHSIHTRLKSGRSQESVTTVAMGYKYKPLHQQGHEIRVLYLQPGILAEPLQVRLQAVSNDHGIEYEALSYTWGASLSKRTITVNGADGFRLRGTEEERVPRVDAICINQHDKLESASQVAFIGAIYRSAARVLVWLGEAEAIGQEEEQHDAKTDDPNENRLKLALRDALEVTRPCWWERVWTVQEYEAAVKPPTFHFGPYEVDPKRLQELLFKDDAQSPDEQVFRLALRDRERLNRTGKQRRKSRNPHDQRHSLLSVYQHTWAATATDPRDAVYGILGIAGQRFSEGIDVDYTRDVDDVMQQATRAAIASDGCFSILSLVPLNSKSVSGRDRPSWMVPFHDLPWRADMLNHHSRMGVRTELFPHLGVDTGLQDLLCDCKDDLQPSVAGFGTNDGSGLLHVQTRMVGRVSSVTALDFRRFQATYPRGRATSPTMPASGVASLRELLKQRLAAFEQTAAVSIDRPGNTTRIAASIAYVVRRHTATIARFKDSPRLRHLVLVKAIRDLFKSYMPQRRPTRIQRISHPAAGNTDAEDVQYFSPQTWWDYAETRSDSPTLFMTREASLGLGCSTLQAGDYLVMLPSTKAPAILRRRTASPETGVFAGDGHGAGNPKDVYYDFQGFAYVPEIVELFEGREKSLPGNIILC